MAKKQNEKEGVVTSIAAAAVVAMQENQPKDGVITENSVQASDDVSIVAPVRRAGVVVKVSKNRDEVFTGELVEWCSGNLIRLADKTFGKLLARQTCDRLGIVPGCIITGTLRVRETHNNDTGLASESITFDISLIEMSDSFGPESEELETDL